MNSPYGRKAELNQSALYIIHYGTLIPRAKITQIYKMSLNNFSEPEVELVLELLLLLYIPLILAESLPHKSKITLTYSIHILEVQNLPRTTTGRYNRHIYKTNQRITCQL